MIRRIDDFLSAFKAESGATLKVFSNLTDESLTREIAPGFRTLGFIAWHLACSLAEMGNRTGLGLVELAETEVPACAQAIHDAYARASDELAAAIKEQWDDTTLEVEDDMYGQMWQRGLTLAILLKHNTHHLGQLTVLMRQAGLTVPGVCGPAKEEWTAMGMEPLQ